MRERTVHWLLLVSALGAAIALGAHGLQRAPRLLARAVDPLSLVPSGAAFLLSVDVAALSRGAPQALLRASSSLLGLRATCGFEPLLSLGQVALAVPFTGSFGKASDDFAVVGQSSAGRERLSDCAEAVIRARAGEPVRIRSGEFWRVLDRKRPAGELAVRGDGLFVLSGGSYLRALLEQGTPAAPSDEAARLRESVHRELRRELGAAEVVGSWLPEDAELLSGISALAFSLRVAERTRLHALGVCGDEARCADAVKLLQSFAAQLRRDPAFARLSPLTLARRGKLLELSLDFPSAELPELGERLLRSLD